MKTQKCRETMYTENESCIAASAGGAGDDRAGLVDIRDVRVRTDLDEEGRVKDFIRQIKNPYCYLCSGMKVKISFSGTKRMEDCLIEHIF